MKFKPLFFAFIFLSMCASADAQRRDYMTGAEQEIVRNNQDIDSRISVLTKMIDRRFAALGIDTGGDKPSKLASKISGDDWGEEPKGTRLELFTDIKSLLEKTIDDIDNLAARMPEKTQEQRKGENIFDKAVRSLAKSAGRWLPHLKKEFGAATDAKTHGATSSSIEFCEQIIEASTRLK